MRQIMTVFLFTFKDAIRKKAFIVSTAIILVLVLLACLAARLFGQEEGSESGGFAPIPGNTPSIVSDEDIPFSGRCYYIDEQGLVPGGLEALKEGLIDYEFTEGTASEIESYRAEIAKDAEVSLILVEPPVEGDLPAEEGLPHISVLTKDVFSGISPPAVQEVLSLQYIEGIMKDYEIPEEALGLLRMQLPVQSGIAGEMDLSGYILGVVITMLMFFAIYYYGYGVAMSIATEKTTRVMETLVVSAKPSRILLGKVMAMGFLGICQIVLIMLFAFICYRLLIPGDLTIMGMRLSLASFTLERGLLILLLFILGYTLYAFLYATCGAAVSKMEDLSSAMMPVMLLTIVSFYISYFTALNGSISGGGTSPLGIVASYVPFCSPLYLPFYILNGDYSFAQVLIALLILVVSIGLVAALSIRIYSASVLHYGKRLRLKDQLVGHGK